MFSSNLLITPTSQHNMQPFLFSLNSQVPPPSLQAMLLQYAASISPFRSELQLFSSRNPYSYEKFPSIRPPRSESPYNPLTDADDSLPSTSPDLSQHQDSQSCSTSRELRSQQEKKEGKNESEKPYPLPKGWTEEKDKMLLKIGNKYKGEWKRVARTFGQKAVSPLFVKYRFRELTSAPKQKRAKFHPTEDLMLAKYYEKYGSDWAQIATHFPNRTAVMLKNRYYAYIRKEGVLEFLTEKVKEMEQNRCGSNYESQSTSESSIQCKEEPNNEVKIKSKYGSVAEEIAELKKGIELYQALYLETKFELDNLKAQASSGKYQGV